MGDVMRIVTGCLIVAAASFGLAPSSPELHNSYGPTDLERFTVRPGITATVQYGADHLACQIQVESYQPLIHPGAPSGTLMSSVEVSEILGELAPTAMRGKEVDSRSFQSSCALAIVNEYENVSTVRGMNTCAASITVRDSAAQIVFKRDICPKVNNSFIIGEPKAK
jgi:hypothetical protein